MLGYLSIGVFIDGGYYAKINRALKAEESSIYRCGCCRIRYG